MFIVPVRPHFLQGHVWREICVDDDATHRVGALDDSLRRYQANAVRQRVYADKPGHIVPPILQGIGIKFCRLVEKSAEQRCSAISLGGEPLRSGLRLLRCP